MSPLGNRYRWQGFEDMVLHLTSMACFLWTTRFPVLLLFLSLFLPSRRGIGGGEAGENSFLYI
jgi:hypothetical protein